LGELCGHYTHVRLAGLWGTYDNGYIWLRQFNDCPRVILWLGSSVVKRHGVTVPYLSHPQYVAYPYPTEEAGQFICGFREVLSPQDQFIIAIDTRSHNLKAVRTAYNVRAGVTRHFAMNVLSSVYDLFNAKVVSVSCSTYSPYYNEVVSKCLRALAVRSSIDDKP